MAVHGSLQVDQRNQVTVISLGREYESLDEQAAQDLHETLLEAVERADPPRVVLDLSQTKFFGSAFIELLFRAWNRLKDRDGGDLALTGLTPYCAEVIEVTHLDRLWRIHETPDEAVDAMQS